MKRLFLAGFAALLTSLAMAGPRYEVLQFRMKAGNGTNTAVASPQGYIDEVLIAAPTTNGVIVATVTGVVSVVSVPAVNSGNSATILYTNAAFTGAATWRPRFPSVDNLGALTNANAAEAFLNAGDPVTLRVVQTGTLTNVLWRAWLKIDER